MAGGLADAISDLGWRIDLVDPNMFNQSKYTSGGFDNQSIPKNCKIAGHAMQDIENGVYEYAKKENFLLMLGGDHSIPIGTIAAVMRARPNTGIVWVDAHADINTPTTSGSGNLHGMPLAFLLGLVENVNSLPSFEYFKPCLKPSDIVYVGLRDVDKEERKFIKDLGIKAFTVSSHPTIQIGYGLHTRMQSSYFAHCFH
jgi:arginase